MIPLFKSDQSLLASHDRERAVLLLIALEMQYRFKGTTYLCQREPVVLHVILPGEHVADWRCSYDRMTLWARTSVTQSMVQSERWGLPITIRFWAEGMWEPLGAVRIDQYVVPVGSVPTALPEPPQGVPAPSEIQARSQEPDLHVMIGTLCLLAGKIETAKEAFQRAIMLDSNHAEAWMYLGTAYYMEKDFPKAITLLRTSLKLNPDSTTAWQSLGNALSSMGSQAAAVACYVHVLSKEPENIATLHNLGNALLSMKQFALAEARLKTALQLNPNAAQTYNTLGNVFFAQDNFAAAAALYELSTVMGGRHAPAYTNFGNALLSLYRGQEAIRAYEKALVLEPKSPGVRYNLALAYLREGNYLCGWQEHEARWTFNELRIPKRKFKQPLWTGEQLAPDKTILVYSEQGLGDCIQFCRYLPMVQGTSSRSAKIIFEVPQRLYSLMEHNFPYAQIIKRGDSLPEFDVRVPLMSLPWVFKTEVNTIPTQLEYLSWPHKVDASSRSALNVGLSWAGNPAYKSDKTRSMDWEPLVDLPHDPPRCHYVCLQRDRPEDVVQLERALDMETPHDPVDMSDTAAIINTLDLVITTDTAVAHLAASMGKPVWLMLAYLPDWRWMNHREDSPWYPTMRLYRQTTPGDWTDVIQRISQALQHLVIFRGLMSA